MGTLVYTVYKLLVCLPCVSTEVIECICCVAMCFSCGCPCELCVPPPPMSLFAYRVSWLNTNGMLLHPSFVFCFAFPASSMSTSRSPPLSSLLLLSRPFPSSLSLSLPLSLCLSTSGLTPALACAPSREVADCLALILATMMPFCSPCSSGAPSPGSLLRQLPHKGVKGPGSGPRGPRSPRNPSGPSSEGTTENDSEDSETF